MTIMGEQLYTALLAFSQSVLAQMYAEELLYLPAWLGPSRPSGQAVVTGPLPSPPPQPPISPPFGALY